MQTTEALVGGSGPLPPEAFWMYNGSRKLACFSWRHKKITHICSLQDKRSFSLTFLCTFMTYNYPTIIYKKLQAIHLTLYKR